MKQLIKDYFNFSRLERIAVIAIIVLLLIIFFLPSFTADKSAAINLNIDTALVKSIQKLENQKPEDKNEQADNFYALNERIANPDKVKSANKSINLFYFNPNTLPVEGWKNLGIREKTIHTIQNYLGKGGKFRKAEDLQKIYGLSKIDYERLAPYIQLEGTHEDKPLHDGEIKEIKPSSAFKYSIVELNTADTSALISLPGIGSKLSARIINFRDKLGGFYSVEQIKETYGLQDSVFQKIKPYLKANASSIKKININTATLDELKQHPYIRYNIANPIILYRNEHGLFSKTEDIKKVMVVTEEVYNKMSPYITTQ